MGRPTLNHLRAVTSTYHLQMKFPIDLGVREVRGEQVLARECYARELKHEVKVVATVEKVRDAPGLALPPALAEWDEEIRDEQAFQQAEPNEPLELVLVDQQRSELTIQVGTKLDLELRQVLVKKGNGKWQMCVDFIDLNKAYPKDNFPLSRIILIVDSTAGHPLLNFRDAYSGYN
ncbi:hypothetical protein F2P56_019517 [Juglans regia]|uniref:Uncharacterized protein LOC108983694 n=2 Tax=Juglans regia TaxID=51240 RepID=A0A2I4DUZ2_JUGRE|nr:uncharacterized protein LOC108983694 [Juglans regia]KAF5459578.1 hypothetical protein F2P56_019517 [Juglans regia]